MFGFDDAKDSREQVYQQDGHESHFSHELLAGGAAFEGMKVFEDRQRSKGETVNHSLAKELIAGFAAAEVDKLCETKGLDYIDREKAKHQAKRQAEHLYDQQYAGRDQYDPDNSQPHEYMRY